MITLKSVKYYKSLSEETLCFDANIYLDGKKIGSVSNRGTGGSSNYHLEKGYDMKFLENYLVEKYGDFFKEQSIYVDTFFDYQVLIKDAESEMKKLLKKTVFVDGGSILSVNAPFSEAVKGRLLQKRPNAVFFNDLPLNDAVELFNKNILGYANLEEAMKKIEVECKDFSQTNSLKM